MLGVEKDLLRVWDFELRTLHSDSWLLTPGLFWSSCPGPAKRYKVGKQTMEGKIKKLEKALDPETDGGVYADIVEKRLGVQVSSEEAKKILELSKIV
ncbi:MAG: hypothetical protein IIB03_10525, partial [Acidobacteria bacterium]|nr:hypothetical protein [Acidobacteriota bacterium]